MIARVFGLTNKLQKRYMTTCIGDMAYFLMADAELHMIPGHLVDFVVVLAITLKRLQRQSPKRRHVPDEVRREMMKVFAGVEEDVAASRRLCRGMAGSLESAPTFATKFDFPHMGCAADLVAANMFLESLETHERRDMVALACKGFSARPSLIEQPDEDHASRFHVFLVEQEAVIEQPLSRSPGCTVGQNWDDVAGGDAGGNTSTTSPIFA